MIPYIPDFGTFLMPPELLDATIQNNGMTFGWMRGHQCPCTYGTPSSPRGTPNPRCLSCFGRGRYWDEPVEFTGLFTYMHTSAAPDEPGAFMNPTIGSVQHAAPTLTIPHTNCDLSENPVWDLASEFDAYVEPQATTRFSTVLVSGDTTYLPYKQNLEVLNVTVFDTVANLALPTTSYTVSGAQVVLDPAIYQDGTGYSVDFTASPVYVAWRKAGGISHVRPFGQGTPLPKRFHLETLDVWLRTLNNPAAQGGPI